MYSKKGGIGQDQKERLEGYKKAADMLIKKFPKLVYLNKKKVGEVLLRRAE